jgi:hypothetical protein
MTEDEKLTPGWKLMIGVALLLAVVALAVAALRPGPDRALAAYEARITELERTIKILKASGPALQAGKPKSDLSIGE